MNILLVFAVHALMGTLGSVSLDVLALRKRAARLSESEYRGAIRSPLFWLLVLGAALISGVLAAAFLQQFGNGVYLWQAAVVGAGAEALLKKGITSTVAPPTPAANSTDGESARERHMLDQAKGPLVSVELVTDALSSATHEVDFTTAEDASTELSAERTTGPSNTVHSDPAEFRDSSAESFDDDEGDDPTKQDVSVSPSTVLRAYLSA